MNEQLVTIIHKRRSLLILTVAGDQRRHHAVVHVVVECDEGARVPARHWRRARVGRRPRRRHRRREQAQIGRTDHPGHAADRPDVGVCKQLEQFPIRTLLFVRPLFKYRK